MPIKNGSEEIIGEIEIIVLIVKIAYIYFFIQKSLKGFHFK